VRLIKLSERPLTKVSCAAMSMITKSVRLYILTTFSLRLCWSFTQYKGPTLSRRTCSQDLDSRWYTTRQTIRLGSSLSNDKSDDIDSMRKMLEASWNVKDMGIVPSTPEAAAEAAAESVKSAQEDGRSVMLIELLLPSYDITQGELYYDEILAAKFCIQLAKSLQKGGKAAIFVKDGKGERLVNRVLKSNMDKTTDEPKTLAKVDEPKVEIVEYNDFEDITSSSTMFLVDDADLFRSQLDSTWDEDEEEADEKIEDLPTIKSQKPFPEPSFSEYQIGSLLGDTEIKVGSPDMFSQVVRAVDSNALPLIEESESIVLLSACSDEEMVAVRRIVAVYENKKPIILVNCKLSPLPRELVAAETVYSLLPLMAKPTESSPEDLFQKRKSSITPKIVVLRRYPRDWDIFVDVDGHSGFELVESVPVNSYMGGRQKGPSMDYIARCVKRHLQFKDSSAGTQ